MTRLRSFFRRRFQPPSLVFLGFAVTFVSFFILPVFLASHVMQSFQYVPVASPIGLELKQLLTGAEFWLSTGRIPQALSSLHAPLLYAVLAPLVFVDYTFAYRTSTLFSTFCFTVATLALPLWIRSERQVLPLGVLVFVTGILSYGFQFAVERGRLDIVALLLLLLAIWLFHYHPRYYVAAYGLFIVSAQFGLFALFFVALFVRDWHDWKSNLQRLGLLTLASLSSLLILGQGPFLDFFSTISNGAGSRDASFTDHSIRSFLELALRYLSRHGLAWLSPYSGVLRSSLALAVGLCILMIAVLAYQRRQRGMNPHLLVACALGALLLPTVSPDYMLAILAAPVAILVTSMGFSRDAFSPPGPVARPAAILVLSIAYSWTLYSYTNKPHSLSNNCPALIVMLLAVSLLAFLDRDQPVPE